MALGLRFSPCPVSPVWSWEVGKGSGRENETGLQALVESGHYLLEADNTLVITEATVFDSTKYTCIARTALDRAERTAELIVRDVPHPPYSAWAACAEDGRSVVIKFNHNEPVDTAAPVEEFWVQYQVDPGTEPNRWESVVARVKAPWGDKARLDDSGESRTIGAPITVQLKPYGDYRFRVIARNAVGDSAPQEVSGKCETHPAVPDRNPADVRAQGNTPDNLVVYWEPMEREDWNGPGFHYVVEYRRTDAEAGSDGDADWRSVKVEDPDRDHVVIENQPMFKPYEVRVAAVNDVGKPAVSPRTVQGSSGQGIPMEAPTGFTLLDKGSTHARFKWDPVPGDSMNGRLAGYKVVYWYVEEPFASDATDAADAILRRAKRSLPVDKKEAIFDAKASQGTVYGLKPFKQNKAYVLAFNDANDGPPSEIKSFMMNEGPLLLSPSLPFPN